MGIEDKIEAVNKVSKVLSKGSIPQIETPAAHGASDQERFQTLMKSDTSNAQNAQPTTAVADETKAVSLMDEVQKLNTRAAHISEMSPENLKKQAQDVVTQLDSIRNQIADAQGDIKPSYQTLLKNRLTHIDESIKIALSKAGAETPAALPVAAAAPTKGAAAPMERFLGLLTQSQYQLDHLNSTINSLSLTGAQLTPANMLALQIKVGQISQEIELFTNLLNKALESTKTLMNVQV